MKRKRKKHGKIEGKRNETEKREKKRTGKDAP